MPLTVQLVRFAVPTLNRPPPSPLAVLPLTVQLVRFAVPRVGQAAAVFGGVAADGAVGQAVDRAAADCTGRRRRRWRCCR